MSCQSKSEKISELRKFIKEFDKTEKTYTEEELEKIDDKFYEIVDELNEYDDLTPAQEEEIKSLKLQYKIIIMDKNDISLEDVLNGYGKLINGMIESIQDKEKED